MTPAACLICKTPLEYKGCGRRPRYCSTSCKSKAKRRRRRFGALTPFRGGIPGRPIPALVEALEAVRAAEERLRRAQAARAALDVESEREPHICRTFTSIEELRALQGGAVRNPGIDVGEVAASIQRRYRGGS
jgi:hypothetical protein